MMKMVIVMWMVLVGMSSSLWAQHHAPASCQPIPVRGQSVMLNTKKPVLFILHNLSASELWVTHTDNDKGVSAGFDSRLQAGKWSAVVVDSQTFDLSCVESIPGHEQVIPCEGVLSICKWSKVKITTKQRGTYWVSENKGWVNLLSDIGGQGFSVPTLDNQ